MKMSLSKHPLPSQNLEFSTMVEQPTGDVGTLAHVSETVSDSSPPFSPLKAPLHLENLTRDFRINMPLIALSL